MDHPLRCRCGTLRGYVSRSGKTSRAVCYCKDCQAYAQVLGRSDILDERGGTDVVATLPRYVTLTQGMEALACLSLTPNGLLRWYTSCCDTPVANTPRNFKVSYVGLVHTCLEDPSVTLDSSFGSARMRVNTQSARGKTNSTPIRTLACVLRLLTSLIGARVDGSYKVTPFFIPDRGMPIMPPRVLTADERARVMNAL